MIIASVLSVVELYMQYDAS